MINNFDHSSQKWFLNPHVEPNLTVKDKVKEEIFVQSLRTLNDYILIRSLTSNLRCERSKNN